LRIFVQHHALADGDVADHIRAPAIRRLAVGRRAVLVEQVLAGDDQPIEDVIEQRRRRLRRRDLHGVFVDRLG
jgi:hypothetical protein